MKIAIIGGGIIGATTNYYLNKLGHETYLFEKNKCLGNESSGTNASLLMFRPNINIYSFSIDINSIKNSISISKMWCFNYICNYFYQDKIDDLSLHLAQKSYQEMKELSWISDKWHNNVFQDYNHLQNTYSLNCQWTTQQLINKYPPKKLLLECTVKELIFNNNYVNKIIYWDSKDNIEKEINIDAVIVCNANNEFFTHVPILPVYGKTLTSKEKNIPFNFTLIDTNFGVVINQNTDEFRLTYGAVISKNEEEINNLLSSDVHSINLLFPSKYESRIYYRPMTPDGLPIIAKDKNVNNLYYNTGHGILGWTWAFGSAYHLSEIIEGKTQKNNPFDYTRFY